MLFSKATGYGIRAAVYIAAQPKGRVCGVREIAANEEIPPVFLRKVLGELRRHRILRSMKGINGGYQLARSADSITLWDLVQLLDTQPDWDGCLLGMASCIHCGRCPVGRACELLRTGVFSVLQSTTLSQAAHMHGDSRTEGTADGDRRPDSVRRE